LASPRKLRCRVDENGYVRVTIKDATGSVRIRFVHRLILESHRGPCPDGMECRHADGNRQNNAIENLSWGTYSENEADKLRHGTRRSGEDVYNAKLTLDDAKLMRAVYASGEWSQVQLARIFCVPQSTVSRIVRHESYKETA
jgi:hypothetical protein